VNSPDPIPEETAKSLSGLADTIVKRVQDSTDPSTRPGFAGAAIPAPEAELLKKFGRKSAGGGYLPVVTVESPTGPRELNATEQAELMESAVKGGFNINLFPRGDIENFSITRWAMAMERAANTSEGSGAFRKWAPWEQQYYGACEKLALSNKAMGDMVSGQDGGFLAPEQWSTTFIDQIYPAQALSRLPVTRINMGTRVTHVPRLSSNIAITYTAEQGSITANQAQLQQISFTARKQTFLVQISNELIRDSNPAAQAILTNNATRYLAIDRDKQALLGDGTAGTPTGLLNTTHVTVGAGFSGTVVFSDFNTLIYNVEGLNKSTNVPLAQTVCSGIVGPVRLKSAVLNLKDTTNARVMYGYGTRDERGQSRPDGSAMLDGLFGVDNWVLTNILADSAGASNVFFGDWQHLWIMQRQDIEILSSNVAGTAFQNDQTWVRGIARYDVGVAHPEAFYIANNF
jgi:hypothetical protein